MAMEEHHDNGRSDPDEGVEGGGRLVVASNRLPVVLEPQADGEWKLSPGSGGLVTALEPVLKRSHGLWIGWQGVEGENREDVDRALAEQSGDLGYDIRGVSLTNEEVQDFYLGFANQVVWPLFHDFQTQCNFDPRFWRTYQHVNRKFARVIAREHRAGDFIWVHDYHLMSVAEELRALDVDAKLGFFLHTPFPPVDLFVKLPWRYEILGSLLRYDLVGFQTARDRKNFTDCIRHLAPELQLEEANDRRVIQAHTPEREVGIGAFPISIDVEDFQEEAVSEAVSERVARIWAEFPGRILILGVDRLDYTKGIPHKLAGYRLALERYPDLQERVSLVQLVIPSREDIPEYDRMKREIERLVGEISGEFTRPGWVPVHYQYGSWERDELIAHYRASRVALVTPLKDGMNLVAKEFCASSLEGEGVLVLSEYAGATAQMQQDALLVNPYDVEGVAEAIHKACTMPERERRRRMERMREKIRREDIYWWVNTFLRAAQARDLGDAATVDLYRPYPSRELFDNAPS